MCTQAGYETLESLKYQLEAANAKLASLEDENKGAEAPPEVAEPAEGGEGEEPDVPQEGGETGAPPEPAAATE